jgi:DNA transposition AAA+ family ATPase
MLPMNEEKEYFDTEGTLALTHSPKQRLNREALAAIDDDGVRETIQKAIQNYYDMKLTRTEIFDRIGIHWRTFSQIRLGKVNNLHKKTLRKLEEFNERVERMRCIKDEREMQLHFIETENVRKVRLTIKDCITNYREGLYIVLGPSGSGKTSALNTVISEISRSSEYDDWKIVKIHVHEYHTPKTLLCEIGEELGLDTDIGRTTSKMIHRVSREFKSHKTVVIFDEADWLMNRSKLNLLRILWDKAPFACYLLGVDDVIENFYKNHAGNRQLMGRIYGFTRLSNLKMDDVFKFFDEYGLAPEVMERIYSLTGGNAHLIRKMLKKIKMFTSGGRTVTEAAAEEIYKNLMFAGQF